MEIAFISWLLLIIHRAEEVTPNGCASQKGRKRLHFMGSSTEKDGPERMTAHISYPRLQTDNKETLAMHGRLRGFKIRASPALPYYKARTRRGAEGKNLYRYTKTTGHAFRKDGPRDCFASQNSRHGSQCMSLTLQQLKFSQQSLALLRVFQRRICPSSAIFKHLKREDRSSGYLDPKVYHVFDTTQRFWN